MYREQFQHTANLVTPVTVVVEDGLSIHTAPIPDRAAREIVAGILESPELNKIWQKAFYSRREDNPAHNLAEMIRNLDQNPEQYHQLLSFMRRVAEIEKKALARLSDSASPDDQNYHAYVESFSDYLDSLQPVPMDDEDMPKDYQHILEAMESKMGQIPIRPLHTTWQIIKAYGKEMREHAGKHKVAVAGLGAASIGLVGFTFATTGGVQTDRINPELMNTLNNSGDNFFNSAAPLISDPNVSHALMVQMCHDNFPLGHLISKSDLLLPHCTRVKTLSSDAQNIFNTVYARMDAVLLNPLRDFAGTVLPTDQIRSSFDAAAVATANFWYIFDSVENLTIHGALTALSARGYYKYRTMDKTELKESWNKAWDFVRDTMYNKPLNYLLCASGSTLSYIANDGFHPTFVWYGLLGGVAGQFIHNQMNRYNAPNLAEQTMLSVRKDVAQFSDPENIVTQQISDVPERNVEDKPVRFFSTAVRKPFKQALASVAAAGSVTDVVLNAGHNLAATVAATTVTSLYWFINVPQDTVIHWIAIVTGAALGEGAYWIKRGKDKTVSGVKKMLKSDMDSEVHEPT